MTDLWINTALVMGRQQTGLQWSIFGEASGNLIQESPLAGPEYVNTIDHLTGASVLIMATDSGSLKMVDANIFPYHQPIDIVPLPGTYPLAPARGIRCRDGFHYAIYYPSVGTVIIVRINSISGPFT
jgi:hypothetical protein